jgi:hypothetical protein
VHRAEVYAEVQAANAAAVSHTGDLESLAGRLARIARPVRPARQSRPDGASSPGVGGTWDVAAPGGAGNPPAPAVPTPAVPTPAAPPAPAAPPVPRPVPRPPASPPH